MTGPASSQPPHPSCQSSMTQLLRGTGVWEVSSCGWLPTWNAFTITREKKYSNPLSIQILNDKLEWKTLRGTKAKCLFMMRRSIHVKTIQLQLICQHTLKSIWIISFHTETCFGLKSINLLTTSQAHCNRFWGVGKILMRWRWVIVAQCSQATRLTIILWIPTC